jgi:hypothetical protein
MHFAARFEEAIERVKPREMEGCLFSGAFTWYAHNQDVTVNDAHKPCLGAEVHDTNCMVS